jgi:hypothetical protein
MSELAREQAARVYARLLAGDVRLYNEEAVITGRSRGDLGVRLEEPITLARRRYLARCGRVDPDAVWLREAMRELLAGGREGLLD